jgi:hypothetical protein
MTAPANILRPAAHARVLAPFALAALFTAQLAYAGPAENPFLPPASTAAAAAAPTENLEFAGINVMSEKTFVVVHDKQAKKSRWIAVGESQAGLTVLAYDPRREQIVVKSGDTQKTLTLRKASGSSGLPYGRISAARCRCFNTKQPGRAIGTSARSSCRDCRDRRTGRPPWHRD